MAVVDLLGIGSLDLAGALCACHCPAYPAKMRIGRTAFNMVNILVAAHVFPAWLALHFLIVLVTEKHADVQTSKVFARMKPPCSSTIFLHIDSPRPVPWQIFLVVKNGSKTRGNLSCGIPSPVSLTWMAT